MGKLTAPWAAQAAIPAACRAPILAALRAVPQIALQIALQVALQAPAFAADPPQVRVGADVRLRGYYLDNFLDFDDADSRDEWSVFRLRTRVYVSAAMENGVSAYVRIGNQHYSEGVSAVPSADGDRWEEEGKSNKFFVDAAYVDVKDLFGLPLELLAGRQNLMYGSGWIIADGQSQYGSTSTYIDGIKLVWKLGTNAALDALYFKDEEKRRDETAPDDITFAGLYLTSRAPLPVGQQEVYFFGRFDQTIRKEVYMAGARLSKRQDAGIDYSAEGAWQTGKARAGIGQNAYGLKLDLGYTIETAATPRIYGGFVRLTGDDYATENEFEGWDVFYGGWPQYGDLLAWRYINAGAVNAISIYDPSYNALSTVPGEAVYSNFDMYTAGLELRPMEGLKAGLSYSTMIADETVDGAADGIGDYYQLTAEYRYSAHLTFALYAALFDPGDAFAGREDPAKEAFWEVMVSF
jgi:hypothetical protein